MEQRYRQPTGQASASSVQGKASRSAMHYAPSSPGSVAPAPTDEETEEAYDDEWLPLPRRLPSSARRYQDLPNSRTVEEGRRTNGQPLADRGVTHYAPMADYRLPDPQAGYPKQGATGVRSTSLPRRSATETNLPVISRSRVSEPKASRVGGVALEIQTDPQPIIRPEKLVERPRTQAPRVPTTHKTRAHWLLFVGLGMLAMVAIWAVLVLLSSWWQVTQDDWHYGRPRTYQVDAVVGHHDSVANPSHFIALNLNHHVEIIEFPAGDPTLAKVYIGPILLGSGQDLTVVTLTFKDLNGDGKPDMIINIENSHFVFINDKGQFRPARPGELGS